VLIDLPMLQKQQQRLRLNPHFSLAPLHFAVPLCSLLMLYYSLYQLCSTLLTPVLLFCPLLGSSLKICCPSFSV